MSDSYRTIKESVIASSRIRRNAAGSPVPPTIRVRRPTPGDEHPLGKLALTSLLRTIPLQYQYGLKCIELLPRPNPRIGEPFGCYRPDEKVIHLYSLPLVWRLQAISPSMLASLRACHAEVGQEGEEFVVRWPHLDFASCWYFWQVFAHELGHHFRQQYPSCNDWLGWRAYEGWIAKLHAERIRALVLHQHGRTAAPAAERACPQPKLPASGS